MYNSISIRNFKCFRDFSVDNLKRINLIFGLNGVGKTALLEALFLHGSANPEKIFVLESGRTGIQRIRFTIAQWADAPWDSVFTNFDTSEQIEISATDAERKVLIRA